MTEQIADQSLERAFEAVSPSAAQVTRIERVLEPAFDAPTKSLAAEWLELLRIRPLLHGALTAATATGLGVLTPLGAIVTVVAQWVYATR